MNKNIKLLVLVLVMLPTFLFSQDLVYKPINPFFGGNTFNYQQLLAGAAAQNDFDVQDNNGFEQPSDLENFTNNLNRQLLNSISRDLFQQQFGDTELTVGTYVFGTLVVDISPTSGGLSVNILDTQTGEQTQIIIPN